MYSVEINVPARCILAANVISEMNLVVDPMRPFLPRLRAPPPTPKPILALDWLIEPKFFSPIETDLTSIVSEIHPIKIFRKKDKNILLGKK